MAKRPKSATLFDANGTKFAAFVSHAAVCSHFNPGGAKWRSKHSARRFAPGDASGDGKVDGSDLALWQQNYDRVGMGGPPSVGAFPSGVTLSELTTYSLPVHEIMFKAAPSKSQATSQTIGREELPMTAAPSVLQEVSVESDEEAVVTQSPIAVTTRACGGKPNIQPQDDPVDVLSLAELDVQL